MKEELMAIKAMKLMFIKTKLLTFTMLVIRGPVLEPYLVLSALCICY